MHPEELAMLIGKDFYAAYEDYYQLGTINMQREVNAYNARINGTKIVTVNLLQTPEGYECIYDGLHKMKTKLRTPSAIFENYMVMQRDMKALGVEMTLRTAALINEEYQYACFDDDTHAITRDGQAVIALCRNLFTVDVMKRSTGLRRP